MENQTERRWYGIQFPNGKWLQNAKGERIVGETAEEMSEVLTRWNNEGGQTGGQVKDFLPAPIGCALYA